MTLTATRTVTRTDVTLMTAAEERSLLETLVSLRRNHRRARYLRLRNAFLERWRPFVLMVVRRYFRVEVLRGRARDRVQDGSLGLIDAVERFDPARGVRFSTFAFQMVRSAVQNGLHRDSVVIAPRRNPAKNGTADLSADQRAAAKRSGGNTDKDLHLIPDRESTGPGPDPVTAETLAVALRVLTPRERKAVRLRFGLDGSPPHTLAAVGLVMGITKERVRQLEAKALERLRRHLTRRGVAA